jgi:hypothetical protein
MFSPDRFRSVLEIVKQRRILKEGRHLAGDDTLPVNISALIRTYY